MLAVFALSEWPCYNSFVHVKHICKNLISSKQEPEGVQKFS